MSSSSDGCPSEASLANDRKLDLRTRASGPSQSISGAEKLGTYGSSELSESETTDEALAYEGLFLASTSLTSKDVVTRGGRGGNEEGSR